jgi:hypothetical protein
MFSTHNKFLYLILISLMLTTAACGAAAASVPDQPAPGADFEAPLSNRTEVHQDDEHPDSDAGHGHLTAADVTGELNVVLVPTELVVGPDRFAVGLFDQDRNMIHEADVHFHYYDLSDPEQAVLEVEADAQRLQTPDGLTTIFAHEREFERAGDWGVEVEAHLPDGSGARQRIGFRVEADSASVSPGESVIGLDTPTLADVDNDLSLITSAREPNPAFYELSLAEAIASGQPSLLLFATPEFCQTRFCGPAYEMFNYLHQGYGDQVNFIHVEVFAGLPDPAYYGFKLAPTVEAFGLESDPWVYLIDDKGTVVYRVEGLFTREELERQLSAHLGL